MIDNGGGLFTAWREHHGFPKRAMYKSEVSEQRQLPIIRLDIGLGHNRDKLLLINLAIRIQVKFIDHGLQLLVVNLLAEFLGHTTQVLHVDLTRAIFIKELEGLHEWKTCMWVM